MSRAQTTALTTLLPASPIIADLGRLFAEAGHQLYLVGGSVRDALLGQLGNDLDFTTSARPDESQRLLRQFTRTVWDIGSDYGTISAQTIRDGRDWLIEVTTFRADTYRSDSRKPEVVFGETVHDDLIRRDFTVNAMALDVSDPSPAGWRFVDPHGGLAERRAAHRPISAGCAGAWPAWLCGRRARHRSPVDGDDRHPAHRRCVGVRLRASLNRSPVFF